MFSMSLNKQLLGALTVLGVAVVATSSATANVRFSEAQIKELVGKVKGNVMLELIKKVAVAREKYDRLHALEMHGIPNDETKSEASAAKKAKNDALKDVHAVTIDVLPQLLQFLVNGGDHCVQEGSDQKEFAYICHTNAAGVALQDSAATLTSCLSTAAKNGEEKALAELFKEKLFTVGGYCAPPGPGLFRSDVKVGRLFELQAAAYKRELEKIRAKLPNDDRLATIKPDSTQAATAGFLARVFDNFGLISL